MNSLCFFPSTFPNEDFRSVLYRYHLATLNKEITETNRELFDSSSSFTVFPRAINKLLTKIPLASKCDIKTILNQNTLLPIFLPFITEAQREKILYEIANGGTKSGSRVGKLVGNKYGRCISSLIKYCPLCMEEDNVIFGCSYIHREHQFSFIHSCKKHKAQLVSHCMECGIELGYSPLQFKCKHGHQICSNNEVAIAEDPVEKGFQLDLEFILLNSDKLKVSFIEHRFLEYLAVKGYMKGKFINCQEFANDLINYYSENTISRMGLNIEYLSQHHTYENIFRSKTFVVNLPLILLMARFFGGTFENFLNEQLHYCCEIPFGLGPWECRNKYCPKYGIKLISYCIRKERGARGFSGKFKCNFCNSSYVRLWMPGKGAKEGRVLFESDEKTNQYIIHLLEQGLTHKVIASKVYRSVQLVKKVAKGSYQPSQVLTHREIACSAEHGLQLEETKKINFRNKLKSVILENRDLSRNQIRQKCSNAYIWLQKNDREWLEINLPPSKLSSRINWSEVDENLAAKIKNAANQLIKKIINHGLQKTQLYMPYQKRILDE